MSPNDTFYKTIIQDYREYYSGVNARYREKQKKTTDETPMTPDECIPAIRKATIKDYSSQELWEELKARGYQIAEGRLVRYDFLT